MADTIRGLYGKSGPGIKKSAVNSVWEKDERIEFWNSKDAVFVYRNRGKNM